MGHEPFVLPNIRRQDNLRRKALTAASSVVLAFGIGACVTKSPEDEDTDDQTYSAIENDGGGETGGGETGGSEGGGGETGGGETGGGETGSGEDTGSDDTGLEDTGTPGAPDCLDVAAEERGECCDALMDWCYELYGDDEEALYDCAWGDESGCSPWGPPVPPRARVA